jgi:hypothetical protein
MGDYVIAVCLLISMARAWSDFLIVTKDWDIVLVESG